jgi:hypothetical protein
MTTNPITPPPELVEQWVSRDLARRHTRPSHPPATIHIATQAAQWGADQELEACCKWLDRNTGRWDLLAELRANSAPPAAPSRRA